MTNGIVSNMPEGDYRKHPAVSASDLKNMQRSPAYARMRSNGSGHTTKAQAFGIAAHTAILEPEALAARHPVEPQQPADNEAKAWRATKLYKEQLAELEAREGVSSVITAQESEDLEWITKRVREIEVGRMIQELEGENEASVFAYDEEFELWRKCRMDRWIPAAHMIVDVKTAADHRPGPFARACQRWGYHLSAAYYLDTCALAGIDADHFAFLVVANEAPHEIAAYTLDEDSIEQGRHEYRRLLAQWRDCEQADEWTAVTQGITELRLPEWSITFDEETR